MIHLSVIQNFRIKLNIKSFSLTKIMLCCWAFHEEEKGRHCLLYLHLLYLYLFPFVYAVQCLLYLLIFCICCTQCHHLYFSFSPNPSCLKFDKWALIRQLNVPSQVSLRRGCIFFVLGQLVCWQINIPRGPPPTNPIDACVSVFYWLQLMWKIGTWHPLQLSLLL